MHNGTYDLEENPFGWNEVAHTIFVEQPIRSLAMITSLMKCRTGFSQASSTAKKTRSEAQIAYDFRGFLSSFLEVHATVFHLTLFKVFSEYQNMPIYITGESYAGFYIPWYVQSLMF